MGLITDISTPTVYELIANNQSVWCVCWMGDHLILKKEGKKYYYSSISDGVPIGVREMI